MNYLGEDIKFSFEGKDFEYSFDKRTLNREHIINIFKDGKVNPVLSMIGRNDFLKIYNMLKEVKDNHQDILNCLESNKLIQGVTYEEVCID